MTVYRDGWRLVRRYAYWHIYDGQGKWRGRNKDRDVAYEEMYEIMGRETTNTRSNHFGNIFGG